MLEEATSHVVTRGCRDTEVDGVSTRSRRGHTWAVRALEALPWVIITAGILVALIAPQADTTPVGEVTLMICLALFFTALLAQLATTARRAGRRRTPLMLLGIGLCLWATGSTVLQAAAATSTISFLTPGETFFLLS